MNLSSTAIRRGVTFGMIYVMAIGFGLFSLSRLKLDLYPEITFPVVLIMSQYTGAGPFDMETVVTRPIEGSVAAVDGVKHVNSVSRNGVSLTIVEFDWGHDMDQAQIDIERDLKWVADILPEDATSPLVFAFNPSDMPVAYLAVGSDIIDQAELRKLAEDQIKPRFERVEGIASVHIIGGLERQIRVEVDARALSSYGLSMTAVVNALRSGNLQVPGGQIKDGLTTFSVRTFGEYRSLAEIEKTIVTAKAGKVIQIRDVAKVVDGFKELSGVARVQQKPAVIAIVMKQSDANTVQTVAEMYNQIPKIEKSLPGKVTISTVFDQAEYINRSIGNLSTSGLSAFLLTALVLLVFLRNIRSMIIVAAAIPTSVILAFFVLDMYGTTLNIISMAGLALAVGMLVDNSIVVLENIYRFRESGEDRIESADRGAKEVGMAITASTLTTIAVFAPVLFVPGISGIMFRDMVIAICVALATSLFVALTLIPLLASRLLTRPSMPKFLLFRWISEGIRIGLEKMETTYEGWLSWSLHHRKSIIAISAALFTGSFFLINAAGVDFLPKTDEGEFEITIERAVGTDMPSTLKTFKRIEKMVREKVPETKNLYSNVGPGASMGAIFRGIDTHSGSLRVKLVSRSERTRTQHEIEDVIRAELAKIPGITYSFAHAGGMQQGADIELKLFSHDIGKTGILADKLVREIKKVPGAADVTSTYKPGAPELQIEYDRDRMQAIGLPAGLVSSTISYAIQGITATHYREGGDEFDIFVRLAEKDRKAPEQLQSLMLATPLGGVIPLRQVADIRRDIAPVAISREDQSRIIQININISGRDMGGVVKDVEKILARTDIPSDVIIEFGGTAEDQQESFFYLTLAIFAGIALVYMVMASQFESLLSPFIIGVTIPLSIIGVALALFITGTSLSLMAMIGMLMLVGIVVNNGIVLVDYTNQVHAEGHTLFEAALIGGKTRMRPVLMTALTTTFGMLPLAIGAGDSGETWAPLARAVMGGLIVATGLTLLVVPVTYTLVNGASERIRKLYDRITAKRRKRLEEKERVAAAG
jgi:hydrophobic/amphiphilic exporter-1 (mainly G- bacteria), HAE1 family